jgi:RNA polymerase sigma-70 factor (ECF subfamily)
MDAQRALQDERYRECRETYAPALERLARAYEADRHLRADLLQDIHLELWRSFALYDGACSLRTWTYRVAHNVGASHILRRRRLRAQAFDSLETILTLAGPEDVERDAGERSDLARLTATIQRLKPVDRQVTTLYLEGLSASEIGEITGLSARHVATRIHRLKSLLSRLFHDGETDADPQAEP